MPLNKDVGNWIKDFMKSNAPQFKGKSKEERKDMALAAFRAKYGSLNEQDDRVMNEERKLTYDDFVQMVRADMNAGAASDEYVSDERVRKDAKWKYNEYLQGVSLDDLFLNESNGFKSGKEFINIKLKNYPKAIAKVNQLIDMIGEDKFTMEMAEWIFDFFNNAHFESPMNEAKSISDYKVGDILSFKDGEDWKVMKVKDNIDKLVIKPHNEKAKEGNVSLEIDIDADYLKNNLSEATDINDPALARFRAQMAAREKKAAEPATSPISKADKNADKIKALKIRRAELMRNMEQEAEPEGGPIADRYGAMLNKIDTAIARLSGTGEWGPETNPYMDRDEIERRAASLEEEEEGVTAAEEDKFHRELDKLVHKTFGHSSDEKKKALADKAMKKIKEVVKVKTPEEAAKVVKDNPDAEVEVVSEVLTEGQHYDYEGKMAHSQLLSIVKNARDLFNMIDSDSQLKSWVQSKLTKAEDYLDSVRTYLEGESLTSTAPAIFENESIKDETGVSLSIGDVVKGGDGRIYQIIYSYSEGKPMMVPFDLKRRKPLSLRDKIYFDSDSSIPKKLNKVMDYTATKGGFMK